MEAEAEAALAPYMDGHGVSFDEIVRARAGAEHDRQVARAPAPGPEEAAAWQQREREEAEERLRYADQLWERFKRREGRIEASWFGAAGPIGAALTIPLEHRGLLWLRNGKPRLHVTLDLATAGPAAPLVSRYLNVCVRAEQRLSGEERQNVIRVVYDRMCSLMKIIDFSLDRVAVSDASAGPDYGPEDAEARRAREAREREERKRREAALAELRQEHDRRVQAALVVAEDDVRETEELCDRAVRRVALMSYFVGMLIGVALFTALGVGIGAVLSNQDITGFDLSIFLTTFVAGAVGAIVSVMSRMSSGDLKVDTETSNSYLRVVGGFRPLIGAIFGVALYFGFASGLIPAKVPAKNSPELFFFYGFIAFLAGFSERWAQDMLVVGRGSAGQGGGSGASGGSGAPGGSGAAGPS